MMQQNRDRNGRPRNPRPYDLNRDVAVSYTHLTLPTNSLV